jgi:hypothetical protein
LIFEASSASPANKHWQLLEQLLWADPHRCLNEVLSLLQALTHGGWKLSNPKDWFKGW